MAFNPLDEKGIKLEDQYQDWGKINVEPYKLAEIDPYTHTRVILMNGIEVDSELFLHAMARHTTDLELKQALAMTRRVEQQQQKMVNWMIPGSENVLEITIGYEQVAVDLTAELARTEPNPIVKDALDFALIEDFDHLYRYANLMEMTKGTKAETITKQYTEITPGRPTMAEHRHPMDDLPKHVDGKTADMLTLLHIMTIVAAEQQTMNFYMNVGNRPNEMVGRGLYAEIAMIEEEHVTHYECLMDPTTSWFDRMLLHDYNEAYMYWSCMQSESNQRIKDMWERHMMMEIAHIHKDLELIQKFEKRDARSMLPNEFPQPTIFHENKDYVRKIVQSQVDLTADVQRFVPVSDLPQNHRFFQYQRMVNEDGTVPSSDVIKQNIAKNGQDYRMETEGPHPVPALRSRKSVDESVGRSKQRPAA